MGDHYSLMKYSLDLLDETQRSGPLIVGEGSSVARGLYVLSGEKTAFVCSRQIQTPGSNSDLRVYVLRSGLLRGQRRRRGSV